MTFIFRHRIDALPPHGLSAVRALPAFVADTLADLNVAMAALFSDIALVDADALVLANRHLRLSISVSVSECESECE